LNYGTLAGWRKFRLRRESGLTNEILMEIERLKKNKVPKNVNEIQKNSIIFFTQDWEK